MCFRHEIGWFFRHSREAIVLVRPSSLSPGKIRRCIMFDWLRVSHAVNPDAQVCLSQSEINSASLGVVMDFKKYSTPFGGKESWLVRDTAPHSGANCFVTGPF